MKTEHIGKLLAALYSDEDGVTAIEYALLGALIAVVIASSIGLLGRVLVTLFERVAAGFP